MFLSTLAENLLNKEQIMSQFIIPEEILWNPIISAQISRYLSRKDRLNCRALIPTWDLLATRILALSPCSWTRQTELRALIQDTSEGVELFSRDFALERGKDITQLLLLLSGPTGTGLANVTTLDIMKQPITIKQLSNLITNCPLPRLRVLSLSLAVRTPRMQVTECLKSNLKLEEVAIRFFGKLTPCEMLLLMQSFGDVRRMTCDDSSHRRYRLRRRPSNWERYQSWNPQWTFLQIHHASELLDLFLGERKSVFKLPELTLLTEPGHFFPKRYLSSSSNLPRIVTYRVLKKPPLDIPQFCRACVDTEARRYMPCLHYQPTEMAQDSEVTVNFVACSLMSVEDNCVLHPLNLHDLYLHISLPGRSPTPTLHNASLPFSASSAIPLGERQPQLRSPVERLIHSYCSEIRRLSIRICKPASNQSNIDYFQHLPSLARDHFLPALEKCGPNLRNLDVSAELIWACCSDVSTRQRLLRLQDRCVNVRKLTVMASGDLLVEQQLRPSAKDTCTYLNVFPALEEVRIVTVDIFHDRTIHEILATCPLIRRLYIFSLRALTFDFATLPPANALELLFLEFSRVSVDNDFIILLNETLSNLRSVKYLLLKFAYGTYPRVQALKHFFTNRPELRWLVIVFHKGHKVLLCHADQDRRGGLKIIKDPAFQLGSLIHTYPELYDIFWSEFHKFSDCLLY